MSMAIVKFSDQAPDNKVRFSFATTSFELSPGEEYKTDEYEVVQEAQLHPWLEVDSESKSEKPKGSRKSVTPPSEEKAEEVTVNNKTSDKE